MKGVIWAARVVLFLLMVGFALSNIEPTRLRFFGFSEFDWQAPLVFWLLIFFAAGALLGVTAMLPTVWAQRRALTLARRSEANALPESASAPVGSLPRLPGVRGL